MVTLQLAGDERDDSPYTDEAVARPLARRIAELSAPIFSVAGLEARTRGLYDTEPTNPAELSFTASVGDALRRSLDRIPPVDGIGGSDLLTVLAFAEPPGWPTRLWSLAVGALTGDSVSPTRLERFARSGAASFLVEEAATGGHASVFRLYHQALNDALLGARARLHRRTGDEQGLTEAFYALWRSGPPEEADLYLLRSLPGHAFRAGEIDRLLTDDDYLLHVDLFRLTGAVGKSPAIERLAVVGEPALFMPTIARKLGATEAAGESAVDAVARTLGEQRVLLWLDTNT